MGSIADQECSYYVNDPYGFDDVYDSEPHSRDETCELPEVHGGITLSDMSPISAYSLIDTAEGVSRLIDDISLPISNKVGRIVENSELMLFVDVKGIDLGRSGSVSILQIRIHPTGDTFLIDIYRLGWQAFTTPGKLYPSETLKSILASSLIPKVVFDVRNGASALFNQFSIPAENILDIQLMEFYHRNVAPNKNMQLMGLWQCLSHDIKLSGSTRYHYKKIRDMGRNLFAPNHGGRPQMFNVRPLNKDLKACIIQDTLIMFTLYSFYSSRLTPSTRLVVEEEGKKSLRRVMELKARKHHTGYPKKYGY
jgi:exonuclease 3'-5' domain-containing protein 1